MATGARDARTPLPWKRVTALCLCDIAHFYTVCSIFSYAGIMSADLGWAPDRDSAGFIAGFLQSSNTLGRIPTSMLWGLFAERWGHKRALMLTLTSIVCGGFAFGMCSSLEAAVVVRGLLLGAGNGWRVLLGPLCFEVAGSERQTEVLGLVSAAGSFTQLFGPALGGWTYKALPGPPALLPSGIGAVFALLGMQTCWSWIPDSSNGKGKSKGSGQDVTQSASLWRRPVPSIIALRTLHGCLLFMLFEVVPLWAISANNVGGLEISEDRLGVLLSISAVGSTCFTARVMPALTTRLGLRRAMVFGSCLAGLGSSALPWAHGQLPMLMIHMTTLSAAHTIGAAVIACTNNAVPPAQRAKVNGIAVTFESCSKGFAPIAGATAFAWTISAAGYAGHGLIFLAMACGYMVLMLGAMSLPQDVENQVTSRAEATDAVALMPVTGGVMDDPEHATVRSAALAADGEELQEVAPEQIQPLATPRTSYERLD